MKKSEAAPSESPTKRIDARIKELGIICTGES
jgi:hypothetical protein